MDITLDTHSLIWHVDKELNKMLSKNAEEAIDQAENTGLIYISVIVLMESLHLIEKGRVRLSFSKLLNDIETSYNYQIIPVDTELLRIAEVIKGLEIHDRLILATARLYNAPLVSSDKEIRTKEVSVIW